MGLAGGGGQHPSRPDQAPPPRRAPRPAAAAGTPGKAWSDSGAAGRRTGGPPPAGRPPPTGPRRPTQAAAGCWPQRQRRGAERRRRAATATQMEERCSSGTPSRRASCRYMANGGAVEGAGRGRAVTSFHVATRRPRSGGYPPGRAASSGGTTASSARRQHSTVAPSAHASAVTARTARTDGGAGHGGVAARPRRGARRLRTAPPLPHSERPAGRPAARRRWRWRRWGRPAARGKAAGPGSCRDGGRRGSPAAAALHRPVQPVGDGAADGLVPHRRVVAACGRGHGRIRLGPRSHRDG